MDKLLDFFDVFNVIDKAEGAVAGLLNFERSGRNCFLYRTPKGAYFTVNLSQWQGESDTLTPVSEADAIDLYEGALREHAVSYAAAFPGVKVEEA